MAGGIVVGQNPYCYKFRVGWLFADRAFCCNGLRHFHVNPCHLRAVLRRHCAFHLPLACCPFMAWLPVCALQQANRAVQQSCLPYLSHPLTFASSGILLQQKPLLQGLLVPAFLLAPLPCAEAVGYRRETTGWDR